METTEMRRPLGFGSTKEDRIEYLKKYRGKWVAIRDGRVVDCWETSGQINHEQPGRVYLVSSHGELASY